MQAIILAGGYGTRLTPLTYTRPKSLLPILNKPMIHHLIDSLPKGAEVIIATNYRKNQIEEYFQKKGRDIIINEEPYPLGTGGATKFAEKYIDDAFLVLNSDIISSLNMRKFIQFHKKKRATTTISLWPVENVWEFGVVAMQADGRILQFVEKPRKEEAPSNLINAGAYFLEKEVLDYIDTGRLVSMEKEIFPKIIEDGKRFYGYTFNGFWIDVGRPRSYIEANKILLKGKRKKYFSGSNCIIEGRLKESCIGDNVTIEKNAEAKSTIIYDNVVIKHNAVLENCIVGSDCIIERDVTMKNVVVGDGELIQEEKSYENRKIWNRPIPDGYPEKQIGNPLQE